MSRSLTGIRWIGIEGAELFDSTAPLGSGTSKNSVRKVTVSHPTRGGTYFKKDYPHPTIAKFEAIALAMTGMPLDDIIILEDPLDHSCSLLTKEISFHSIHDLFSPSPHSIPPDEGISGSPPQPTAQFPQLSFIKQHILPIQQNPTELQLQSLADIFVSILVHGNDDCHACNLGLLKDFSAFVQIDLDALKYLVNNGYRDTRYPNSSHSDCFKITAEHIDALFNDDYDRFPHYHPLKSSGEYSLTSKRNYYTLTMTHFFKSIIKHPHFGIILTKSLLRSACQDLDKVRGYCDYFELDPVESALFIEDHTTRIETLRQACIDSTRVQTLLANAAERIKFENQLGDKTPELNRFQQLKEKIKQTAYAKIACHYTAKITHQLKKEAKLSLQHRKLLKDLHDITANPSHEKIHSLPHNSLALSADIRCLIERFKKATAYYSETFSFTKAIHPQSLTPALRQWIQEHVYEDPDMIFVETAESPIQNPLECSVIRVKKSAPAKKETDDDWYQCHQPDESIRPANYRLENCFARRALLKPTLLCSDQKKLLMLECMCQQILD